jgi:hypothetical protein
LTTPKRLRIGQYQKEMYLQVMPWVVIQEERGIKGRERRENMRGENKVEHEWRFNIFPTYGHVPSQMTHACATSEKF